MQLRREKTASFLALTQKTPLLLFKLTVQTFYWDHLWYWKHGEHLPLPHYVVIHTIQLTLLFFICVQVSRSWLIFQGNRR